VGLVTFEERTTPRDWTAEDKEVAAWLALRLAEPLAALPPADAVASPVRVRELEVAAEAALPVVGGRRTHVRRVGRLESAALVAAEEVVSLLDVLDVQAAYLRMVETALETRPEDRLLIAGAHEAATRLREGLVRLSGCAREGIPDKARVDLNQLLPTMIPALAREMGEGGRLRIAPTSTSLPVEVNPALMERAIVHLIRNAREASASEESVRLSWGPTFQQRNDGTVWEGARIRVEDRGMGIPRHDMPWIFEPFFSTRPAPHPLRGLGLPLVQGIVEGHNGWVEVQSRAGEGTEVALYLPLASQEAPASEGGRLESTAPEPEPEAVAKVVLLEDEPMFARLVSQMLERSGCSVHTCSSPLEVERYLRETRGEIDLLVVASALAGGRPGRQLAETWKARRPDVPVVLLDRGSSAAASTAVEGDLPVIRPPFEMGALAQVLARALKPATAASASPATPAPGPGTAH
jgi:signal transduction histidine kinase/ActR/RegA family two-component response regulator